MGLFSFFGTPVGPNLVVNPGFDDARDKDGRAYFFPSADDPGVMTLIDGDYAPDGTHLPPFWDVTTGIHWFRGVNTNTARFGGPVSPYQGANYFLDLTAHGDHPTGGVRQLIQLRPGRSYRVTVELGTESSKDESMAPVQVVVLFYPRLSTAENGIGLTGWVRLRREHTDEALGQWNTYAADVRLRHPPQAEVLLENTEWALSGNLDRRTWVEIRAQDLLYERTHPPPGIGKSTFLGLGAVWVQELSLTPSEALAVAFDWLTHIW
jgi:hypothetical protein